MYSSPVFRALFCFRRRRMCCWSCSGFLCCLNTLTTLYVVFCSNHACIAHGLKLQAMLAGACFSGDDVQVILRGHSSIYILLSELCVKQQSVWTCLWMQVSSLSVNCMLLTHFQHFSWDLCTAGRCTGSVPRSSWEFNLTTQDRHFTLCLFCLCCDKFDFSSTCAAGNWSTYW